MMLFTKKNCSKCDYVKDRVNLKELGIEIEELDQENYVGLARLAWYELVAVAETQMPILVLDDNTSITGALPIVNFLREKNPDDRKATIIAPGTAIGKA